MNKLTFIYLFAVWFFLSVFEGKSQDLNWVRQDERKLQGAEAAAQHPIICDKNGNFYIYLDNYVAKHDALGNKLWEKKDGNFSVEALVLDNEGNIYVLATSTFQKVIFDGMTFDNPHLLAPQFSDFLIKLDRNGKFLQIKFWEGIKFSSRASYSQGALIVHGLAQKVAKFDGLATPMPIPPAQEINFVGKISLEGKFVWVNFLPQMPQIGGDCFVENYFDVDENGSIYMLYGKSERNHSHEYNLSMMKWDMGGKKRFEKEIFLSSPSKTLIWFPMALATTSKGDIYVSGCMRNGNIGVNEMFSETTLMAKYDSEANLLWNDSIGQCIDCKQALSTNSKGDFYTWLLSPKDNNNGFSNQIAKYDKNGSLLWQFQLPEKTVISGIKANDLGDVLVSGELFSNMILNGISGYFLASIRDNSFFINPNYIKGSVYEDINNNCTREPNEKGIPNVIVKVGDYISTTNKHGDYQIATTTGNYKVSSFLSSRKQFIVKNICKPSYSIFFPNNGETRANIDFPLQVTHCSYLSVDIASNRRRRCFRSQTVVTYQNEGFGEAQNVQLKVIYPKYIVPIHSSKQWESQQDSLLIFNIGTLKAGQTGRLVITDSVVCGNENIRGLTQCTKAIISPASSCIQPNPAWDRASIAVDGYCDGKSAHFTIKNIGMGDMKDSTNYRIFFDVALVQEKKVKLKAGESLPLVIAAKGRTVRVEADQVPNHPTESEPNTTVDACGRIVFNILAQSPVRQLPQDNKSEHAQTSCMEIIDSYDPNDKQVNPIGVTEKRFIKNTDLLEYLVRFQNTGSDTAYTVVIRDTLSKFLDVSSLAVGASSHSYTWSISGKGNPVLTFTFDNINLPHAKRDEEGSNGFVKFKIRQIASNPIGTKITNRAGIYFDFNSPIITNETLNEIGDPIVKQLHKPENLIDINICDALAVPTAAQAGNNQTVSTNQAELSANVPEKGIGVWKVVSGTGRIANPNEAKTRISNLSEGENVLEWTVSLCGRVSISQVKITYTRIVSISSLGNMLVASEGDSYQWYKDGQAIPGATQRTYTPTVAGVYSVVVTKSGIATTSASITITGIEESLLSQQVHLYPNPTQHQVIVEFSFAERGNLTLNLLDYLGRKVHTENLLKTTPTLHYSLISSHLPQGLYLLQFEINGYRGIKRMVKE